MKKPAALKRNERVILLYNEEEFKKLKKLFSRSICKSISRYVRKISLEEPVEMIYRNLSFDAFIEEVTQLRKELSLIRQLSLTPERELLIIEGGPHEVVEDPRPVDGLFHLPHAPGLGLQVNEAELAKRRVPIA